MFHIKICGLTHPEDAQAAVEAGADALGVNFYSKSVRSVSVERAIEIVHEENIVAQRVGVFVNMAPDEINRIAGLVGLAWAQLHGNESPSMLRKIAPTLKIIRTYRVEREQDPEDVVTADLRRCGESGRLPDAVLIDAHSIGEFGGTGQTVDWSGLVDHHNWLGGIPLVLAGGLRPHNVGEAIRLVQPAAVDVASGVERTAGRKDREQMRAFCDAAGEAFEDLHG